jgi:hypothetical protein
VSLWLILSVSLWLILSVSSAYGFSTGAPTRFPHSVHEPS